MYSVKIMRVLRQLRGETLEELGAALGFKKSTLSSAERISNHAASPRLRRALTRHFGLSWARLCQPIDTASIADAIVRQALRKKGST